MSSHNYQQGSVAIYIALLTVTIITSAALSLSGILARQIRNTEGIIESEQAYYAATSGVEQALYLLVQRNATGGSDAFSPLEINDGEVSYEQNRTATYKVKAQLIFNANTNTSLPCIDSEGSFNGDQRRVRLDQVAVTCDF